MQPTKLSQFIRQTNRLWVGALFLLTGLLQAQTPTPPAPSDQDLVEIQSIDPTIRVELKYATSDNLAKKAIYPSEFKARLRRGVAVRLKNVQTALRAQGYGLLIWDAWRPLEAQRQLYAINSDPRYVATPGQHSMHNRGVAVDATLVDLHDPEGQALPMPTGFDDMTPAAHYFYDGKNPEILHHLQLLQAAMKANGFYACRTEWWHFFARDWEKYPNVDTSGVEAGKLIEK